MTNKLRGKTIVIPKVPGPSSDNVRKAMKAIKSKNTKPEIALRKALYKEGFRFRIHYKLPGKPDIVFPGKKLALFVDGCFWHGCQKCEKKPKTNTNYWNKKIARNMQRARTVNRKLNMQGWSVIRIWEHEVLNDIHKTVIKVKKKKRFKNKFNL
jgi:DNA mismatch endonuclease (patch repair protein)